MSEMLESSDQSPAELEPKLTINPAVVAHRFVQAGMLLGLVWKWSFFVTSAGIYAKIPLEDPFFPSWLESVWTLSLVYLGSVAAILLNLITGSRILQRVCSAITFLGASVLCIHQGSYNDMTFVTTWWASLWSLWYVYRMDDLDQGPLLRRAAFLSRIIISMILLGGAAGKWTGEYWSGDVLYDIYFVDREFWLFNWMRSSMDADALRWAATWHSRMVIATETIAGLGLWLLPARAAAIVAILLLASIALMSNFFLFSVLFSLIGLAAVGLLAHDR